MTTIKKIVCAIDLTKASHNAFDRALSIARASKARLYIFHAVPANYPFSRHQRERLELLTSLRERAEREGVELVRLDPNYPPSYLELGQIYEMQGNLAKAAESYDTYVQLAPNYADTAAVRTRATQLRRPVPTLRK